MSLEIAPANKKSISPVIVATFSVSDAQVILNITPPHSCLWQLFALGNSILQSIVLKLTNVILSLLRIVLHRSWTLRWKQEKLAE